jgi:SAM-dependent methyltransferase
MITAEGDPWLGRWLPLLAERSGGRCILELGCGGGRDTATLAGAGHRVIALELDPERVAKARERCPSAEVHAGDVRNPFPLEGRIPGAVVASLSLHYFPWAETERIVERIRTCLPPGGLLLCRLNSTQDFHHGAGGHTILEENFYQVGDLTKRFFDEGAVRRLFRSGWTFLSLEEHTIDRYEHLKVAWEVVLERSGDPA